MSISSQSVPLSRHRAGRAALSAYLRTTALFAVAFAFFYIEPVVIGPTNFASAWKVVALAVVMAWMVTDRRFRSRSAPVVLGTAYAFVACLNPSLLMDPVGTITFALKALYIPIVLVLMAGLRRSRNITPEGVLRFAKLTAVFVAISTVPFLAGFLEPISAGGYDLSLFGLQGSGFTGIFFSSHGASIVLSTAAVILAYSSKQARSFWLTGFYGALMLLSLYCVYDTFARTGYVMAALGLIITYGLPLRGWKILFLVPFSALVLIFAFEGLTENDSIMMRLRGENVYTLASGRGGDVTSGRLRFWAAAVESYWEGNPAELLTGVGEYRGTKMIEERARLRVGSHNEFVDSLLFAGVTGLILFVLFMFHLMRMARYAGRDGAAGTLATALFATYVAQMVLQGERVLLSEVMLVLVLVSGTLGVDRRRAESTLIRRASLPKSDTITQRNIR